MKHRKLIRVLALGGLGVVIAFLLFRPQPADPPPSFSLSAAPDLLAHSEEFRKEVIRVTEGVHVAVGFGLANSILLEGTDGVVIVDTMESAEAAAPVKEAFRRITAKPVRAIIYTHFHTDHTNGTQVMAGEDRPEVIAHATTQQYLDRVLNVTRDITYKRAMRQFGTLLPEGGLINAGIGPRLLFDAGSTTALLPPTRTFSQDHLELEISGVRIVLLHAPGETPDQIAVWIPEKRVLLPADNYYKSFPNLYAIRGTAYRDVMLWVRSLDRMRALRPQFLVPHHTRPLSGEEAIQGALTRYRDAIQFVHDQTIRWMNRGLLPDEIVEKVKLPAHLAVQPDLQEFYGSVAWAVRAVFDGYLGWFGGNATDLFPLPPRERAQRFLKLVGGEEALLRHAREAVSSGDDQWALELLDHLLQLNPAQEEARRLKGASLRALGAAQRAATGRNYYLTQALEVEGKLRIGTVSAKDLDVVHAIPLAAIFAAMSVNLDPVKSAEVDRVVGFRFSDTDEVFTVHVRRGVAEIQPRFPERPDSVLTANSRVWKEIVARVRHPALAYLKGDVQVEGSAFQLASFLGLFRAEED